MHEPNANVNADRVPRSGHLGNVLTLSAFGGASLSGSCTTPCHDQSVPTIDAAGMGIRAASDRFVEYHGVSITCAGLALGHSRALTRAGADARTFTQIRSPTTDAPPPAGCGPAANAAGTRTAIAPTPTAAVPSRRRLVKPTPDLVTSKLAPRPTFSLCGYCCKLRQRDRLARSVQLARRVDHVSADTLHHEGAALRHGGHGEPWWVCRAAVQQAYDAAYTQCYGVERAALASGDRLSTAVVGGGEAHATNKGCHDGTRDALKAVRLAAVPPNTTSQP